MIRVLCALAVLAMSEGAAEAHDTWAHGEPVPAWVKSACCGPEDSHHLKASEVHALADGWHIDGIGTVIPYDRALPSQDGDFWAFWPAWATKPTDTPPIYCFFSPPQSF